MLARLTLVTCLVSATSIVTACEKGPPEIIGSDPVRGTTASMAAAPAHPAGQPSAPAHGPLDLKTATEGVPGTGPLYADIDTEQGNISCKLFDDKAPTTVANFVGLARGLQPFMDPATHSWMKRPAYDMTTFHRVISGFMIQGGDPTGTGGGDPGYTFADEIWPGATHDRAGLLCMANRGAGTNGMQFFITDAPAPHLDALGHTIFGECTPLTTIHKIATLEKDRGDKPKSGNRILKVTVRRGDAK